MSVMRCQYIIFTNQPKQNGQPLDQKDLINVGYMAGRFGISLDNNLTENKKPQYTDKGTIIDVNSCTAPLLEENLKSDGIKFNKIA
jgi:hypothetical protein